MAEVIWDDDKDRRNREKHGVSFQEAAELFTSGVDFLEIYDEAHSFDEDRFLAIGPIVRGVVLVVWTERAEEVVRVISARWATPRETDLYHSHIGGVP